MSRRTDSDRLWDLPRVEGQDDGPVPPDEILAAYRAGALPADESTRLEWRLAGSRRGRERLAALAGVRLDASPRRRSPWIAALVAAAAMITIAALLVVGQGKPPALPEFSVRVEGLASVRGVPGEARAYASQRVRVVIEPRGEAVAGLTFAAYREEGGGLMRLIEAREIEVTADRGSASLTAEAGQLVGLSDGTRPFFVVVSNRSGLPDRITSESALSDATGGKVYRVNLTIVPRTENVP
jgi:hypothetical protein